MRSFVYTQPSSPLMSMRLLGAILPCMRHTPAPDHHPLLLREFVLRHYLPIAFAVSLTWALAWPQPGCAVVVVKVGGWGSVEVWGALAREGAASSSVPEVCALSLLTASWKGSRWVDGALFPASGTASSFLYPASYPSGLHTLSPPPRHCGSSSAPCSHPPASYLTSAAAAQVLGDVHIVQEVCIGTVFFISGLVLNTQELKKVGTAYLYCC